MSEDSRIILTAIVFLLIGATVSYIAFMAWIDKLKKEINELKSNKINISRKEIKEKAFWWSVDYKPFHEELHYREYAQHGFVKGFEEALKRYER